MGFIKKDQKTDLTNLKNLISLSRMTKEQIADDCGISVSSINLALNGRYEPSVRVMCKLADYFNVPIDYLIGRVSEEQKELVEKDYYLYFKERRKFSYEFNKSTYEKRPSGVYPDAIRAGYFAPWPYNIVNDILQEDITWIITEDQENGLNHAIGFLSEKTQQMIFEYYKNDMNLEDIGKKHHLSRERIRQIIARGIRILRCPRYRKYIEDGIVGSEKLREEEIYISEQRKKIYKMREALMLEERLKDIPIEDPYSTPIDDDRYAMMSVRLYNCLRRSGISTINDIITAMNDDSVLKIRNFGRKTYDELSNWLKTNGVKYDEEAKMWVR